MDSLVLGTQKEIIGSLSHDMMRKTNRKQTNDNPQVLGVGQLTLAEHSLCPLHAARSLQPNLVHESTFDYTDSNRTRCRGHARVSCPLGLLAGDEFYLWGLLGLTLVQPDSDGQLYATPHYCLRQLGLIDQKSRRGGRQYQHFASALERLSTVSYQNTAFYDPVRREHRNVSLRFFSYSLPLDPNSSRVCRIVWDPLFFELVAPVGGHLLFDIDLYRGLDPASRRLFLLLSKLFWRRKTTPRFELRKLSIDVLGFSPELADRDLRRKLTRCIDRMQQIGMVIVEGALFQRSGGRCTLSLKRGSNFQRRRNRQTAELLVQDSALFDNLKAVGFERRSIHWLLRSFPMPVLREWADITLAARERKGEKFFRRSPQAWFVDNVRHAAAGTRTPPDWWGELQKREQPHQRRTRRRQPERVIDPQLFADSPDSAEQFVRDTISAAQHSGTARPRKC